MKREPSTLFAPGPLSGPGSFELLPMSRDIQAIYDAARINTPFSKDVDAALAAHRAAHGEPEQIEHAKRLDPCDAMPSRSSERYRAYVSQRRYAVAAHFHAGIAPLHTAQLLNVPVYTIYSDRRALGLYTPHHNDLAGHAPDEVRAMVDDGATQKSLSEDFGLPYHVVSHFLHKHRINPSSRKADRQRDVKQLRAKGLNAKAIALNLGVPLDRVLEDLHEAKHYPLKRAVSPYPKLAACLPAEIQSLLDQGLSQGKLAKRLGVSQQAVSQFCRANGLAGCATVRRRKGVTERQAMVRRLSAEGLSNDEIAARLAVPKHIVSYDRTTLRLPRRKKSVENYRLLGLSRAEVQDLLVRFETGSALARHLNTSSAQVFQYLKRAQLKAPGRKPRA